MTRSTQRDELGAYLTGEGIYGDWDVPEKYRGDDVDRLAAYEDTGLDPEEIEQLKRERDAAIEDIPHKCWSCGKGFHTENGFDCDEAHYRSGYKDCLSWRWRGQKEER